MSEKSEPAFKLFIIVLISVPALALGAVHAAVQGVVFLAAAGFLLFQASTPRAAKPSLDAAGGIIVALMALTLVQLLPLPSALVEKIAPALYDVRARALAPLGAPAPGFMPLTLDTTLTLAELGKLALYAAVYFGCLHWTRHRGPRFVLRVIAATGLASAAVFILHRILLLDAVYGFYEPIHLTVITDQISAPLINTNHMAGLLGLSTTVAIGVALEVSDRSKRLLILGIAAMAGAALLLTLSRGGIAAFVGSQLLFITLRIIARQKGEQQSLARLSLLPVGLTLSLGLGMFVAQDAIIGEFLGGDIRKIDMAFEGIPLIARFWPTGVGRGAFGVSFQMTSSMAANATATHAENIAVQILSDFGLIFGSAAIIAVGLLAATLLRSIPKRADLAAALAALVGFGIHNLVDFNSEIPGVAVIAVALLAVLMANRPFPGRNARRRRLPRPVLIGCAVIALTTGVASLVYLRPYTRDTEERLLLSEWKRPHSARFTRDALEATLIRHPADWFIPYLVGIRHYHRGDANPLPWLARAVELNPHSALAHYYIGGALLRAGHLNQGMLELRLAARSRPALAPEAARLLVSRKPLFSALSSIAVTRNDKVLLWASLAREFSLKGIDDQAEAADLAVLQVAPLHPHCLARHVRRLNQRGQVEEALALAAKLAAHPDLGASGAVLQAEIHQKRGAPATAAAILEKALEHSPRDPNLLRTLAWAQQKDGRFKDALRTVDRLKGTATTVQQRAAYVVLEANISEAEGRYQATLARLNEAHTLTPWNTQILLKIAELSEKTGDDRRALQALRTLSRDKPDDAGIQKRLKDLERRIKSDKGL